MHTESVGKVANEMIYFLLSLSIFRCFCLHTKINFTKKRKICARTQKKHTQEMQTLKN